MKSTLKIFPVVAIGGILLSGCQIPQTSAPQTHQITCRLPKIDIRPEQANTEIQSKGGLEITVTPALYKPVIKENTTLNQVQPNLGEALAMNAQTQLVAEQTTTSRLEPDPNRLVFMVNIRNGLNHVFHGQGSEAQFNVDGRLIPTDKNNTDYTQLSAGLVPPLDDIQLAIKGPSLGLLKDNGNVSIFLYDLPTGTDPAGNVTNREQFTWDFSYTMQDVTNTAVSSITRTIMDKGQFQQLKMQETMRQMQQMQQQTQQGSMQ